MSITHNKKLIPLLNLLISCIAARSASQILSTNDDYTFRFLNFQIVGLSNSSTNSLLDLILFLVASPEADLSASEADISSKKL